MHWCVLGALDVGWVSMKTAGRLGDCESSRKGGAGVSLCLARDYGLGIHSGVTSEQRLYSCSPGSRSTWAGDSWSSETERALNRPSSH